MTRFWAREELSHSGFKMHLKSLKNYPPLLPYPNNVVFFFLPVYDYTDHVTRALNWKQRIRELSFLLFMNKQLLLQALDGNY